MELNWPCMTRSLSLFRITPLWSYNKHIYKHLQLAQSAPAYQQTIVINNNKQKSWKSEYRYIYILYCKANYQFSKLKHVHQRTILIYMSAGIKFLYHFHSTFQSGEYIYPIYEDKDIIFGDNHNPSETVDEGS